MSHASGAVRFKDGGIWFYEYDGTSDVVLPALYSTYKEMKANWRKGEWKKCSCGKEEEVEIYSDYGFGTYFTGKACRNCGVVSSSFDEMSLESESNGGDDWASDNKIWETMLLKCKTTINIKYS